MGDVMPVSARDVVAKFAPNAKPAYRDAFAAGDGLLASHGITTPLRLAHFMAQCFHETAALTLLIESGRYSKEGLAKLWDGGNWHKYFEDRDACLAMADQCAIDGGKALFSLVYSNRMGNGAPKTGDGWTYRGRGILQTTGRESYRKFGKASGVDFEKDPDLVISAAHALKPALLEWKTKNCNAAADDDDIEAVTKAINGGLNGLADRKEWFGRIRPFIGNAVAVPVTPAAGSSREKKVQEKLRAAGFKHLVANGVIGPDTKDAIRGYCLENGLPPSSDITPALLRSMGIA